MDKIVTTALKLDLHIHSNKSSSKDGKKVSKNTLENVHLLVSKLVENEVNICSITDHDTFSYDMYKELKKEEYNSNSIKKVLPGVEFSVEFENNEEKVELHVVTIFSDECDEKVKEIEKKLKENLKSQSCSEEKFLSILREINLDTILIVHQKNSLTSRKPREKDANSVGEKRFWEFIHSDYFEAYEFKNKKNEIMNKRFIIDNELDNQMRFVTGTDCHDWSVYPREYTNDNSTSFLYTYAKCLPTFKGLVMAVTENKRLKTVNSFFGSDEHFIDELKLKVKNSEINVPLSKGINVVIGDNSIGKSLLLHSLTNYKKDGQALKPDVKKGYKKYLKEKQIDILTQISLDSIFYFDMQGEIRTKFEENGLNTTEFLNSYFPNQVNPQIYRQSLENEITRLIKYLEKRFEIEVLTKELKTFKINIDNDAPESLSFISNLRQTKKTSGKYKEICDKIKVLIDEMKILAELKVDESDKEYIKDVLQKFYILKDKYQKRADAINDENSKIEKVATAIENITEKHGKSISDKQKQRDKFSRDTEKLTDGISNVLLKCRDLPRRTYKLEEINIEPNTNLLYKYEFISKLGVEKINNQYFSELVQKLFKKDDVIDFNTISKSSLEGMLKKTKYDASLPVLNYIQEELKKMIEEDLKPVNSIIFEGMDKFEELSSGLDAQIYFDILSHEKNKPGIYIIDQPEDNISQKAIRTLLERFKAMAEQRQIILVTHNPQFIVNLDVDNLIYLSKVNGEIVVQSGALEYACSEYSILDIVADNIDGGLDTIRKRWKKYEKATKI